MSTIKKEIQRYKNINKEIPEYWSIKAAQGIKYLYLLKALFPKENYLTFVDIGCGGGHLLSALIKEGYLGCGVEPAKKSIKYNQYKNLESVVYEKYAHKTDFIDYSFDLLICTDVLEHIPEKMIDKTFQEFNRITKRGIFLTISLEESLLKEGGKGLHVTVKSKEWWLERINKNISGVVKEINLFSNILIVKIEKVPIIDISDGMVSLSEVAKSIKNYSSLDEFQSIRDCLTIQNYNVYKKLGYKNILNIEQNIDKILLLGAGHNFSKNIDLIKQMQQDGYSVWACNHVSEGLANNGIIPDYMFAAETREVLIKTLFAGKAGKVKFPNIVLHSACHPKVFQIVNAQNRYFYFSNCDQNIIYQKFFDINKEKTVMAHASVSGYMLEIAAKLNPKEIKTLGYDFIIENNKPYDQSVNYLNNTPEAKLIYNMKLPVDCRQNGVEYRTTWLYKKFVILIGITLAKMKINNPEIKFERLGYSPMLFNKHDDLFLAQFKEAVGKDYEEMLETYSIHEIIDRAWSGLLVGIPNDVWLYCMIPDKIMNYDLNLSKKEAKNLKEKINDLYEFRRVNIPLRGML